MKNDGSPLADFKIIKYHNGMYEKINDTLIEERIYDLFINDEFIEKIYCLPVNFKELIAGKLFSMNYSTDAIRNFKYDIKDSGIHVVIMPVFSPQTENGRYPDKATGFTGDGRSFKNMNEEIIKKMEEFSRRSELFARTGGVHSCLFFDYESEICFFEDVGRFNAIDRCIGYMAVNEIDSNPINVLFSGRLSVQVVEKLSRIPVSVMASFSAPTSGGVRAAVKKGIILMGFVRNERSNIYNLLE